MKKRVLPHRNIGGHKVALVSLSIGRAPVFVLRLAFSLVIVSFLLNGGEVTSGGNYPTSAHESAAKVVAAVGEVRTLCTDQPLLCEFAGALVRFGAHLGEAGLEALTVALDEAAKDKAPEDEAPRAHASTRAGN